MYYSPREWSASGVTHTHVTHSEDIVTCFIVCNLKLNIKNFRFENES